MSDNLQFWANVSQVVALFIAIATLVLQLLTSRPDARPSLPRWFRVIRPFLPFIFIAAVFFSIGYWLSSRTSKGQLSEETREIPVTVLVEKPVEVTRIIPATQFVEVTRVVEIPVTQIVIATPLSLPSEGATTPVASTEISSVSSPTPSSVAFEDNFERGYSNQWEIILGNPISVDGHLTSDTRTLLFVGDNSWKNYELRLLASRYRGLEGCSATRTINFVAVRASDQDNFYAFSWGRCDLSWWVVQNGNWSLIPNSVKNIPAGESLSIQITLAGDFIETHVNGESIISFTDQTFSEGRIGLGFQANVMIDDVSLELFP